MTQTKFLFTNGLADGSTTRQSETHVFNMPKLMGSVNRTSMHNVDSQGNAQMYTIGVKLFGTKADALITCAPDTYYVRRAVKAWHDARVSMFKRAGISMKSLGYGRNLRPYLDVNHANGTTVEIDSEATAGSDALSITPAYSGDEWTYSRAVVSTAAEEGHTTAALERDLVDTYTFTLLGDSVEASSENNTTENYESVGMVGEWLDSFSKGKVRDISNESIDPDNALLQLRSQQSADKEELLELAQETKLELRPWDLQGAQFKQAVYQGFCTSSGSESNMLVFNAPCGLFNLTIGNSTAAEVIYADIEVLDIRDM